MTQAPQGAKRPRSTASPGSRERRELSGPWNSLSEHYRSTAVTGADGETHRRIAGRIQTDSSKSAAIRVQRPGFIRRPGSGVAVRCENPHRHAPATATPPRSREWPERARARTMDRRGDPFRDPTGRPRHRPTTGPPASGRARVARQSPPGPRRPGAGRTPHSTPRRWRRWHTAASTPSRPAGRHPAAADTRDGPWGDRGRRTERVVLPVETPGTTWGTYQW